MTKARAVLLMLAALGSLGLCARPGWWYVAGIAVCVLLLVPVMRSAHPEDRPAVQARGLQVSVVPDAGVRRCEPERPMATGGEVVPGSPGARPARATTTRILVGPCAEPDDPPAGCE